MFVICTLLAQTAITLRFVTPLLLRDSESILRKRCRRIYAVTGKSIRIAIGFATVSASQVGLGIYLIALTGKEGGKAGFLYISVNLAYSLFQWPL